MWRSALTGAVLCAAVVLMVRGDATGVVSPHDSDKPRVCLNCHTEEIYARDCDESEGYCLLAGSVDGLCLTCHLKEECCKVGQEHQQKLYLGVHSHPTDIDAGDIPQKYFPRTLPIFLGRISCRTCHLHRRESPERYKMLRLVEVSGQGVDWTVLCHDCHKDR